ncbi:MAG: hypothetical protein IH939_15235 [Acidobacteria bacterium]|nr:hypothetical protein [Acidobacteriota bacterium]
MRHGVRLSHVRGGRKQVFEDQLSHRAPAGQDPRVFTQHIDHGATRFQARPGRCRPDGRRIDQRG